MGATAVFAVGSLGTLLLGLGVVAYLRRPLRQTLVEICGNDQRASFWTAFSAIALALVSVIFVIACRPAPGPNSPAVFELADQFKWGLIGLMSTVLVLGWVIGRSVARWEARTRPKSQASATFGGST